MSENTIFKGWIPVVSGNLSFNEIGRARQVSGYKRINVTDKETDIQTIAVLGKRNLNDGWLPPIFYRLLGYETVFRIGFICYSKSCSGQKRSELEGLVYLTTSSRLESQIYESVSSNAGSELALQALFKKIKNSLDTIKTARLNIKRNGECTLTFDEASIDLTEHIAQQFYFFVKDACHHHYHHNPKSDSVTKAYRCSSDDDFHWKVETLFSLHRSIIAYRRYNQEHMLNNAIGISSYSKTFEKKFLLETLSENIESNDIGEGKKYSNYCSEQSISSINVVLEDVKRKKHDTIVNVGLFTTVLLATLALIISFKQLDDYQGQKIGNGLDGLIVFSISNPVVIAILFASFIVTFQTFIIHSSSLTRSIIKILYDIFSRIAFLNKWLVVLLFAVATCIAYYISFKYGLSVVK